LLASGRSGGHERNLSPDARGSLRPIPSVCAGRKSRRLRSKMGHQERDPEPCATIPPRPPPGLFVSELCLGTMTFGRQARASGPRFGDLAQSDAERARRPGARCRHQLHRHRPTSYARPGRLGGDHRPGAEENLKVPRRQRRDRRDQGFRRDPPPAPNGHVGASRGHIPRRASRPSLKRAAARPHRPVPDPRPSRPGHADRRDGARASTNWCGRGTCRLTLAYRTGPGVADRQGPPRQSPSG